VPDNGSEDFLQRLSFTLIYHAIGFGVPKRPTHRHSSGSHRGRGWRFLLAHVGHPDLGIIRELLHAGSSREGGSSFTIDEGPRYNFGFSSRTWIIHAMSRHRGAKQRFLLAHVDHPLPRKSLQHLRKPPSVWSHRVLTHMSRKKSLLGCRPEASLAAASRVSEANRTSVRLGASGDRPVPVREPALFDDAGSIHFPWQRAPAL
jgi:hypothetical protein